MLADGVFGDMDFDQVRQFIGDQWLFFLFGAAIFCFIVTKAVETKEGLAKLLGPIGRRILEAKKRREYLHREELKEEAKKIFDIGALEPADYQTVKRRLSNVLEEVLAQSLTIREIQLENRGLRTFILQDEDWHWEDARVAARDERQMLPRVDYDTFMADFMKRNAPRQDYVNGT